MLIDTLETTLANHQTASLSVQGMHWNLEGIQFPQYHEFFGQIYSDYYSQVDKIAEYIRIIQVAESYAPATIESIKKNSTIKSVQLNGNDLLGMVKKISEMNQILIDDMNTIFQEATKENHQGLADYCASRIDTMNKLQWQLTAITK